MDQEKAHLIIDALANGINPITGECFPENSPYNNPEIIRALFYVLRNQPIQKKQKKTLEEKQQENLEKGLPMNYGLPWSDECIELVVNKFQANTSIDDIADELSRKPSSIISLLKKKEIISEEQAFSLGLRYQTTRA